MKSKILLIVVLIAGAIIGSLIAQSTYNVESLNWLSYSKSISISPFTINLLIAKLTFGIDFSMSIGEVLFMIIAVAFYPKLSKMLS